MKYIAKPFIIEAIQWDGTEEGAEKMKKEFGFDYHMQYEDSIFRAVLEIYTSSTTLPLYKGEYLIKNLIGEPYACRVGVFKQRFQKVRVKNELKKEIKEESPIIMLDSFGNSWAKYNNSGRILYFPANNKEKSRGQK